MCLTGRRFHWLIALGVSVYAGFAQAQRVSPIPGLALLPAPLVVRPGLQLLAAVDDPAAVSSVVVPFNVNAADTTNTDVIRSAPFNLTGSGLTVGIWEAGNGWVRSTHQELTGRVTFGDAGGATSDHATHVAGTIAASGVNAAARGMATSINIKSYTSTNDLAEMAAAAGTIVASNHSYGLNRGWTVLNWGIGNERTWFGDRDTSAVEDVYFGKYDSNAAALDSTLYNNPRLLSVWSAGNDRNESGAAYAAYQPGGANTYVTYLSQGGDGPGPNPAGYYRVSTGGFSLPAQDGNGGAGWDSLSQYQVAKNGLVVGAIDDLTSEGAGRTGTMSTFSSWGPTDDGRMKPDVVGNGVGVFSSIGTSNTAYDTYNGTSMAAPNVTGSMALVNQRLMNKRGTSTIPLSATSKAIAVHTAHDIFTVGPDYSSGYGVLDAEAAVNFIDGTFAPSPTGLIVENSFAGSDYTLSLTSAGGPVKVTLVWTDPAGAANVGGLDDSTKALVNNLDLWLVDGLGNIYRPWSLDRLNPSAAAVRTVKNSLDNIEQVLIDSLAAASALFLHVGITGSLTGAQQNFSLAISGAVPEPSFALATAMSMGFLALVRRRNRPRSRHCS